MSGHPPVAYVRSGDVNIGYQVAGEGPIDILWLDVWSMPLEARWDQPAVSRLLHRLTGFGRLITFDKRGTGLSDPVQMKDVGLRELWVADAVAVLDAVGSTSSVVVGINDGGPTAMVFAAMYPQRTSALVLVNTAARLLLDHDKEQRTERLLRRIDRMVQGWHENAYRAAGAQAASDPPLARWIGMFRRLQASPATGRQLFEAHLLSDVRDVLGSIRAPTLVLSRPDERGPLTSNELRTEVAARIEGARSVELPGDSTYWWIQGDEVVDEIEAFVTGVRPPEPVDRVLATVLFTDMVRSTERLAELGDRRWRTLLDEHDRSVEQQVAHYRGRPIKSTGDGILATFDGPAQSIRCARAIGRQVESLGVEVRAGVHTGEVELRGDDVAGLGVVIASACSRSRGPARFLCHGRSLISSQGPDSNLMTAASMSSRACPDAGSFTLCAHDEASARAVSFLVRVRARQEKETIMSDVRRPSAETGGVTQEYVLSAPLPQFPGKQITIFIGNFPPGSATPLHRHPGTEILFVLEGEGVMHVEGADSRELRAGHAVLVSPDPGAESFTHQAVNTEEARPMRNLVIVIHDEGTPAALPVSAGES